jgi:hypothetical protein
MGKVEDISVPGGLTIFNSAAGQCKKKSSTGGEHYVVMIYEQKGIGIYLSAVNSWTS